MDPNKPPPSLNYQSDLPAGMTPQALIEIYSKLWELQTQTGLKSKAEHPKTPLSEIHLLLESLFEEHRSTAFVTVL